MQKAVLSKVSLKVIAMCLLLIVAGFPPPAARAQQAQDGRVTVQSISTRSFSNGTVVSIRADGSIGRAQTWADSEGYHVVVPSAVALNNVKAGPGVKVRQLGSAIEILVQTRSGANVTAQSLSNRLSLTVDGKLEPRAVPKYVDDPSSSAEELALSQGDSQHAQLARQAAAAGTSETSTAGNVTAAPDSATRLPGDVATSPNIATTDEPEQNGDWLSAVFSDGWILTVIGLGLILLLAARLLRAKRDADKGWIEVSDKKLDKVDDLEDGRNQATSRWQPSDHQGVLVKQNGPGGSNGASPQRKSLVPVPTVAPTELFGAYRVDQEVGKLVLGQPHRMDVLASRAPDDRRAIAASLLKVLMSPYAEDDERRRAGEALEEYGFVAQQSALLLLASDPYERTSAAKMLGDIKSPASLPFLLEALYDHESIVRNQAVLSIGELKLPSAIGALLDIARKQTDVPGALLSRALSACSVEGLDFFDSPIPEPGLLSAGYTEALAYEFTELEPAAVVEDLPESADDQTLTEALSKVETEDLSERSEAIKSLAQFAVQSSITALGKVARLDPKASIRAQAISSLASINHESVFPSVLIGMADESREVRAAAARSLSRLSFDRADAYVRVMETHDAESLRDIAQACIKAGIVSQGIDRLASSDRRQVYEAFSIVSLLAKANMIEPIVEAIENHPNLDLRLTAVRLLRTTGQPVVLEQLGQLAVREGMPEAVKVALLEALHKAEEAQNAASQSTKIESELHEQEVKALDCRRPGLHN
jgi:HEAT repeat protein